MLVVSDKDLVEFTGEDTDDFVFLGILIKNLDSDLLILLKLIVYSEYLFKIGSITVLYRLRLAKPNPFMIFLAHDKYNSKWVTFTNHVLRCQLTACNLEFDLVRALDLIEPLLVLLVILIAHRH